MRIGATQLVATKIEAPKLAGSVLTALKKMASQMEITGPTTMLSFQVEGPAAPLAAAGGPALGMAAKTGAGAKMAAPSAFHVVMGKAQVTRAPRTQIIALVAKEMGGRIVSYREMHSR